MANPFSVVFFCSIVMFGSLYAAASECTLSTGRFAIKTNADLEPASYEVSLQSCAVSIDARLQSRLTTLRRFKLRGELFNWFVDEQTLQTGIAPTKCFQDCEPLNVDGSSHYAQLLKTAAQTPSPTANAGLQKAHDPKSEKVFLTVDLCPTSKKLQTEIFERIRRGGMKDVPVALAVSGYWIKRHHEEFIYLLKLQDERKIHITWVNHSLTHPYHPSRPLEENFLLAPHLDFKNEVLGNEMVMLGQGIVPSVFFRFPGLISSDRLIVQLKKWGLAPLGSNTWLAKGQKIKNGSVILVHGNGNELNGLDLLYRSLDILPGINQSWDELNHVHHSSATGHKDSPVAIP